MIWVPEVLNLSQNIFIGHIQNKRSCNSTNIHYIQQYINKLATSEKWLTAWFKSTVIK